MNILNTLKNNTNLGRKTPQISSILLGVIIGLCLSGISMPMAANADLGNNYCPFPNITRVAVKTIKVMITAYSSSPDETDDTPFITASNKYVRDGIIANNLLPFGTKVRIPALYGDKIFVVEDRMHKRKPNHQFDIWFPSKQLAINFGVKTAELEILED
jgi:3D (Asp-Asp-Asp) domain-containing protein